MKRLKKGFTLIELLAVIIVLAVVAVVAVPIVLDVIEESRDSANKTTAYNIIDAAKLYYTESSFDEEKKAAMSDEKNIYKLITMSNEIPEEGQLYINEVGKVSLSVVIDNKCYIKHFDSDLQVYDSEAEECSDYVRTDTTEPEVSFEIIGTMGENGWYKANEDGTDTLYVKINATDTESGISQYRWCEGIDCTPINTEIETGKSISIVDTPKTMVCVEAIDKQGNSSGLVCSQEIKKDTQAPEFSGVGDLTVEVNGIIDLEKDVEVNDVMSGLVLETKPQYTYSPENIETNQTKETEVIYEAKDKAGNIRRVTRKVIVSSEAPTITFTAAAGAINGQGWAKNDFYVTINVSDNSGYGIKSFNVCTSSTDTCDPSTGSTITGKTSEAREIVTESNNNRICVQATDNYNQTSNVICSDAYKLDKTAPTAGTIKVNGSSEIKEWYTENVIIEAVEGTDGLSGHLSSEVDITSIEEDTKEQKVTVTTTDKAGNVQTREYTIRLDKKKPVVTFEVKDKDGENGWYKSNVTLKAIVSDENYAKMKWCQGINCTPTIELTETTKTITITDTEGTGLCVIGIDQAGSESEVSCSETIKVDTVKPEFSGIADIVVEKDASVSLTNGVTVSDATSKVNGTFTTTPTSVDTSKAGVTNVTYTVKDKAGNEQRITRKVEVATSAPTITFVAASGAINANGWAKNNFYVTINVSDNSGHGIKSFNVCTATTDTCDPSTGSTVTGKTSESREIVTESNNNRICVQATDNYNQTSSVICSDAYKLDKTKPTAGTIKVNGSSTINAWYTGNVTIEAVNGSDSLSDHLSTTASPLSITSNTDGTTVTVTTKDKAGNEATRNYTIKIDKTTPTVSITKSVSSNKNVLTAKVDPANTTSNYTYKWYKNGSVISGATSSSYTTTEAGTYKVVATTGAGVSATSNEITIASYSITYNVNGGTCTVANQTKVQDISITLATLASNCRSGYEFLGWGTSASDTTVDYAAGATYTENSEKNLYAIWRKTVTITFYKNGAASITPKGGSASTASSLTQTCYMYNAETSCSITSPTISASTATPTVLGWGTSASATSNSWSVNTAKSFSSNASYYAVTKKDAVTYTATFNKNNATLVDTGNTDSATKDSCTIAATYNGTAQATSCQVHSPNITAPSATPTVLGFNTSASATSSKWNVNTAKNISSNVTYYAITRKDAVTYTATFGANNATLVDTGNTDSATKDSCTIAATYNGTAQATSCQVHSPNITAPSATPTVLGFNTSASATSSGWNVNTAKNISSNVTYYAITKKDAVTYTATFNRNNATISKTSAQCTIAATYNGTAQATSCQVTAPTITAPSATPTVLGFNTSSSATSATVGSGAKFSISSNPTYYAITRKDAVTYTATFNGNGATISKTSAQCTIAATYNGTAQATSCNVTAPTISRSGYTIIGFNTSSSATTAQVASGATFSISSNPTYYAITKAACSYAVGTYWDYGYTGGSQTFTVPCAGTYKLEVWGAQGGNATDTIKYCTATGGYGGYSYGNKALSKGTNVYVVVGGQGATATLQNGTTSSTGLTGGYNGGGTGTNYVSGYNVGAAGGSGGGATHMALNQGTVLSSTSASNLLIVAGGGGGASDNAGWPESNGYVAACSISSGGTGGGTNGGSGGYASGGSQSAGGSGYYCNGGSYGQGGNAPAAIDKMGAAGGGGGYYGGASGTSNNSTSNLQDANLLAGGGGSGYIGGVTSGDMKNGHRSGHGYARITLVSITN